MTQQEMDEAADVLEYVHDGMSFEVIPGSPNEDAADALWDVIQWLRDGEEPRNLKEAARVLRELATAYVHEAIAFESDDMPPSIQRRSRMAAWMEWIAAELTAEPVES
ncbi:MAG: hypothetical protein AB1941_27580 [Gemmatimonadota bacterium]